jgi:gliding motility-associated-like protein
VDRCYADIEIWGLRGDDKIKITTLNDIARENGPQNSQCDPPAHFGLFVRPRIKKNIYRTTYTFSGPGVFELRYYDIARVSRVQNIANSGATAFYVETILNNNPISLQGINNSPLLLNDPLDEACINRKWTHNPGGYDPDGDSLSYQLINPRQYEPPNFPTPVSVPNYRYPDQFGGSFTINEETGLVTWDAPQQPGWYNIAIQIDEWRDGRKIGEVVRDMAVLVKPCENKPPEIEALQDTCVRPNSVLNFPVQVRDPDQEDSVYFYLNNGGQGDPDAPDINNGPFAVPDNPATFTTNFGQPDPFVGIPPVVADNFQAEFNWAVQCSHIKEGDYQVDFYAHDDIVHESSGAWDATLAANHITRIQVRPGPIDSLNATPGSRQIALDWTRANCPTALGYEIYRSTGPSSFEPDSVCCDIDGLQGSFEQIAFVEGWDNTTYVDSGQSGQLAFQNQYCYRVVARYEGGVLSCPSPDTCVRIKRDFALMMNDSVAITDQEQGSVLARWTQPRDLDTTFFPPPYTYDVFRSEAGGGFERVAQDLAFSDTTLLDNGLNTDQNPYSYRVRVYDATGAEVEPARSNTASSIFVTTEAAHRAITLNWTEDVPWNNERYEVYRAPDSTGNYQQVASVPGTGSGNHSYVDRGLTNNEDYCYFIRSYGSYGDSTTREPLVNDSQIACDVPRDTVPPCLPEQTTVNTWMNPDCERLTVNFNLTQPPDSCGGDFDHYTIRFSRDSLGSYSTLHEFSGPNDTSYTFRGGPTRSIAGCYRFVVEDSIGNQSQPTEPICFDNCPLIELPNVFTPNGDGFNDYLVPTKIRSISEIRITVYDRWGTIVQPTRTLQQPQERVRLWDGRHNGEFVPAGVYFYRIEADLELLDERTFTRTGSVTVLR